MKEGWIYQRLGDVCKVQNGFAFESKLFNTESKGLPLIRIRDIKRGYSKTFTEEPCDDAYIVNNGEYLIGMDGDFNVGYWSGGKALLNQRVCKLVPSNSINPRFLYYTLPKALLEINAKTAYSTVKHLSSKQVADIFIPNIPLSEQERIVAFLDAEFARIDALKANTEKQLQAAKDLFQSALKQLLTPQEGWERKMLKDVSTYYNGLTYKPTDVSDKGFLVLRSSNIQNNILSLEDQVRVSVDINEKLKIHKGDIIMCSRNGSKALIGKVAIIPEEYNDMTFGTFMMVFKGENNPFLYYFFLSDLFKKQIWRGEATMINQITRYMLDEVYVYFPSLPEQERIVARLDTISEKVKALQANYNQTITLCNDLKQSLLKSVFE